MDNQDVQKQWYKDQGTLANGVWTCNHCQHPIQRYAFFRIKAHINGTKRKGTKICQNPPPLPWPLQGGPGDGGIHANFIDPQNDELINVPGGDGVPVAPNNDLINAELHPNELDVHQLIENEPTNEVNTEDIPDLQPNEPNTQQLITGGEFVAADLDGSSNNSNPLENHHRLNEWLVKLTVDEKDVREQSELLKCQGRMYQGDVDEWLNKLQDLKTRAANDHNSDMMLFSDMAECQRSKPLVLSNDVVGAGFKENLKKIWELLKDEQVLSIGVHGMGGEGKTLLVTHVMREIERKKAFNRVFWVTVSCNTTTLKLQNDLANTIGIKVEGDDKKQRATTLLSSMDHFENSLLILDDVWDYIDLEKVGIPLRRNRIKMIFTTRLKHLCDQMSCPGNTIKMVPLCYQMGEDEGWNLFLVKLGYQGNPAKLSQEVELIAKSIVRRCGGLPLAINVIARMIKGKHALHQWQRFQNKLEKQEFSKELKEGVFEVIKQSYNNLTRDMQTCFLFCEEFDGSDTKQVIQNLAKEGLVKETGISNETYCEGQGILEELESHSLIRLVEHQGQVVEVHPLMKDMARWIKKSSNSDSV